MKFINARLIPLSLIFIISLTLGLELYWLHWLIELNKFILFDNKRKNFTTERDKRKEFIALMNSKSLSDSSKNYFLQAYDKEPAKHVLLRNHVASLQVLSGKPREYEKKDHKPPEIEVQKEELALPADKATNNIPDNQLDISGLSAENQMLLT